MLESGKFIIFRCPEMQYELERRQLTKKNATYSLGSYNKLLVSQILKYNGLEPCETEDPTLFWGSSPELDERQPNSFLQRCNHFPFSKKILGNKGELAQIIQHHPKLRELPAFFPKTFVLPKDREILYRYMRTNQKDQFIAKPPTGSCGHGIKLVTFNDFYGIPTDAVVSQYISRPLCIDGFKFDLRVYVLVTSFAPLHAFVSREGLARFATESYSTLTNNVFSHLTNATLNKHGRNWSSEFKWKLTDVLQEINHRWRQKPADMMKKICTTVARGLALVQHVMAPKEKTSVIDPFFELYGFDLLIDRDFTVWLLEINTLPSLIIDEDVDFEIKGPLVAQTLSIAGIPDIPGNELRKMQDGFDMPGVDIQEFEREKIRAEDERNEASGNGFVRIFPAKETEDLASLLITPKYLLQKKIKSEEPLLDPLKYSKCLSSEQALDVLLDYLTILREKMDDAELGRDVTDRVTRFLAAQGYQVTQRSCNIRGILQHFIERQRPRCQVHIRGRPINASVKARIVRSGDNFVSQVLLNTPICVRNLRELFY